MQNVFDFDDYREYLNILLKTKGRGGKLYLAKMIGCSPTHISNVLGKKSPLTLDQAAKIVKIMNFSKYEGRYFFELVNYSRAGNAERKKIVKEILGEIKNDWSMASRCNGDVVEMSDQDIHIYFSSRYYMAIEIITSIPEYQTLEAICSYFSITEKRALKVLDFLCQKHLIRKEGNKFIRGNIDKIFISKNQAVKNNYFRIWRNRAIDSFENQEENNLHLTQILSISKREKENMGKLIVEKLTEIHEKCQKGPSEILTCVNLDFFTVK